ncbi:MULTISPECIES: gamma-glutamylcyclotransferase [Mesorhizobium]|uniref:gamma-glutamylcyclotransferase n=1 Tax=Mesorhizobium TaxID=68287 RepID=UPI000FCADB71|nr:MULTISPECIES: gamma-glutamylcyclotransferase [Mesorhizobium]RVB30077.1 gamma-glutamylcyclotransferase [Mesorhizobium sp. M7A.F.Ca.CA.004.05.1.1]MCF6123035.1 gamma-glutamylcyclotransferase [Mesorhizobium ciceri]MCQ8816897.1 gamma-glutamylcyclotransferase [Mesorhizobium sp. SEMIA396]RUX88274.1 gamma-glutamylcyclotransferase [Mesorhizobium sp. M7A.F.Ca.CA.004.08.1.1]RUY52011.1 gamma-glutamylcyclotransferase [Mesorhizobium sp. M7A.F.Ca.CA.001.12.1.1]
MERKPAGRKPMALTAELVAQVERVEPDPGPEPGTSEHTDVEFDGLVEKLLLQHRPETLWVFAYGSLIWNPEFAYVEQRPATAPGWHRSFCLKLTRWRGTRDLPALMLALDRGGSCSGIVYRLPAEDHFGQLGQLMRREIDANPPTNVPCWIKVKTRDGPLRALAFVAAPDGSAYAGRLPLEQVADTLARAAGHWGSSAQYLFRTVSKLEESGIRDRNLWRIQDLVARQIAASTGGAD